MRWASRLFQRTEVCSWINKLSFKKGVYNSEIWARLILYNFCEIITAHVSITKCTNRHVSNQLYICHTHMQIFYK